MHICIIEYMQTTKSLPQDIFIRRFRRDYEKYLKKFNDRLAKDKIYSNLIIFLNCVDIICPSICDEHISAVDGTRLSGM
ncbi:hypothetical protein X798_06024 [Onchocerca flexuosa]|uniref:Uncharacterized protein n=1 Tax=Onchocerca flexuosa TaxID=387005 RepID=A0A238BNK5_9BILA|nr:hypothetical protein X798_06024 [Onchocerca flexuosa]